MARSVVSGNGFSYAEQKVFRAAAIAHLETGRPISTHQSMSTRSQSAD
ncbi:hypothetical protein [Vibrio anguillarum]|nr:hypothetical protein [Vibrio anguillarum]